MFSYLKTPDKITLDNDLTFQTYSTTEHFKEKDIIIHFSPPYRHTGNSDIERLHSTRNEHFRINQGKPTKTISRILNIYNKTIHLTTKERPLDIHLGLVDNQKNITKEKN